MPTAPILLIGERDPAKPAHQGIEACFALFSPTLSYRWLPTTELSPETLHGAAGIWATPGSPYANTENALAAIRGARMTGTPFLGTCGGFQHALMEFAATELGHPAAHAELDDTAPDPLIHKLACSLVGVEAQVHAPSESWYAQCVGGTTSQEVFHCNYGLTPRFVPLFAGSDLEFIAHDEENQVRAFRLKNHPFFVGTLFQPERRALTGTLHPLVAAFLQTALPQTK